MPSYAARAIVLRKTRLGETDVILTLLASDGRQVRAVAKGMRKPTSRFAGRLQPYSEVDCLFHGGRNLDVIAEVETVVSGAALREDFDRSSAAAVVVDTLDRLTADSQADERLFGLARATLDALSGAPLESLTALVVAFLIKAMAITGYKPELMSCASCACDAAGSGRFSLGAGGVVCPHCGDLDPATLSFSPAAREWLGVLLMARMSDVAQSGIPDAAAADCFALVRSFVTFHVPARLKALDFFAGTMKSV